MGLRTPPTIAAALVVALLSPFLSGCTSWSSRGVYQADLWVDDAVNGEDCGGCDGEPGACFQRVCQQAEVGS